MKRTGYPKITVVTPNHNQVKFLETTIQSVLNQKYPNLEYIIIDGGSTDGSVDIIKKYEDSLCYWESQLDNGMYEAINKGFTMATGEIMCWINSDDILWPNSLHNVRCAFVNNPNVHWLQGFPTVIDEKGEVIFKRAPVYSKFYFYLLNHLKSFSFIQQESTFWTKVLWEKAGGYLSSDYQLASDFDLWMRFFNIEKLYCTKTTLGAFRSRKGQQSSNKDLYLKEASLSLQKNFKNLNIGDGLKIRTLLILHKLRIKTGISLLGMFNNRMQIKLIGELKMLYLK